MSILLNLINKKFQMHAMASFKKKKKEKHFLVCQSKKRIQQAMSSVLGICNVFPLL